MSVKVIDVVLSADERGTRNMRDRHYKVKCLVMTCLFGSIVSLQPMLQKTVRAEHGQGSEVEFTTSTDEMYLQQPENDTQTADNGEAVAPSDTAISKTTVEIWTLIAACVLVFCNPYGFLAVTLLIGTAPLVDTGFRIIETVQNAHYDSASSSDSSREELAALRDND